MPDHGADFLELGKVRAIVQAGVKVLYRAASPAGVILVLRHQAEIRGLNERQLGRRGRLLLKGRCRSLAASLCVGYRQSGVVYNTLTHSHTKKIM